MQAFTPAMEGWKKRIGRIANNFEAANKETIQDGSEGSRQACIHLPMSCVHLNSPWMN